MDDRVEAALSVAMIWGNLMALIHQLLGVKRHHIAVKHLLIPRSIVLGETGVHPLALLLVFAKLQMDLSSLGLKVGRGCHVRGPWVGLLDVDVLVGSVLLLHHDVWGLGDEGRATDFLVG